MNVSKKLRVAAAAATLLGSIVVLSGSAQAAVPGLVRISNSVTGTADFQSVTATCGAGDVLVGAGYQVTGATGEVIVDDFVPTLGPPGSVFVGAYEADPDYLPNWTLTAFAICADPLPGLVLVSDTSISNSIDKSVAVSCPAGTVSLSAAYQVNGATGEVAINFLRPTVAGATVSGFEEDLFGLNWTLTAFAICANPPPGLLHITAGNPIADSLDFDSAPAACPPGRVLLGLGFQFSGASGEVVVDDFLPDGGPAAAPDQATIGGYEADGLATDWTMTAVGVCATA